MTLMSKYKEQMDKIYVDDKMKMRVIKKIKEGNLDETLSSRKYSFKRYGRIITACSAFIVTYVSTINYTELINKEPIHINNEENFRNYESITSENNEENNMESNIIGKDDVEYEINEEDLSLKNKRNNIKSNDFETSDKPDKSFYSFDGTKETSNKDISINNSVNTVEDNKDKRDINDIKQEYEAKESCNSNIKAVSQESDSESVLYEQDNIPDFTELGFEVIYLNQISKNEYEVMYSDLSSNIKLWIKIFNKQTIDLNKYYSIISNVEYNQKEVLLCIDNEKNTKSLIYLKNEYVYCISFNKDMDESLIEELLSYI